MTQPPCFGKCGRLAAGYSAYCAECQPRDTRQQPRASQYGCGACDRIFATGTDFDHHQEHHPREGVFTGRCLDPASIGLEEHAGVWGTPEGNANRQRLSAGMASCRAAQARALAQTADQDHPGGKDMGQLFTPLDFAPLVAPMPSIGS